MISKMKIWGAAAIVFSLFSCALLELDADHNEHFFVTNKGADMPVWVRGNSRSEKIIIFLEGGPGIPSFYRTEEKLFQDLEERYIVVYYDQRGAGTAQGVSTAEDLNLNQHVEDCDRIVDVIQAKYSPGEIFLMGHSWGGALGTAYLLDSARQEKITGWIPINSAHDFDKAHELSREIVISDAEVNGNQTVLDWYKENPVINRENYKTHLNYLYPIYLRDLGIKPEDEQPGLSVIKQVLWGRINALLLAMNIMNNQENFYIREINLTPELYKITLPALIIWGKYDYSFPPEIAETTCQNLGTPIDLKSVVMLPNSGHNPLEADIPLVRDSIIRFIDTNY